MRSFCASKLNKLIKTNAENLGKGLSLNVGHESFSAFDSLYGILVNVDADQLHFIRKSSL